MKGSFELDGTTYQCEVKDGARYVEGKTVDEFYETLTFDQKLRFSRVGREALKDERLGVKPLNGKYEAMVN